MIFQHFVFKDSFRLCVNLAFSPQNFPNSINSLISFGFPVGIPELKLVFSQPLKVTETSKQPSLIHFYCTPSQFIY